MVNSLPTLEFSNQPNYKSLGQASVRYNWQETISETRQTNGLKRERNTQMQDYKLLYKASTWVILNKLHRKKVVGKWLVCGR